MFIFFRKMMKKMKEQRGAAMVEYGLLVAGVALVGMASVSLMGHETTDLFAAVAAVLPGAHADDNGGIISGKLIETTSGEDGDIALDAGAIATNDGTFRLGENLGFADNAAGDGAGSALTALVVEARAE